jgi:hypothetical protein
LRIRNLIFYLALLLAACLPGLPALAQVEHAGFTAGGVISAGDGNGASYNAQAHVVKDVWGVWDKFTLKAVAQGGSGLDMKLYLGEYGVSGRGRFTGRAYFGKYAFLEGGTQAGLVRYRPRRFEDGYSKYSYNPILGGGVTFYPKPDCSVTANYQYLFERNLYGSNPGVNRPEFIDGRQGAQRGGLYAVVNLPERSKHLLLVNFEYTRGYYKRAFERYGPTELGPFRSSAVTFGVGYGRRL